MTELTQIKSLLSRKIGVVPETLGPEAIERAVDRRLQEVGCETLSDYYHLIFKNDSELACLIDAIVIPESWFFRDSTPFKRLAEFITKRAHAATPSNPIRCLSAPCAAGEEPYSIAMLLSDLNLSSDSYSILGVDISSKLILQAGKRPFGSLSFRGDDLSFRPRHFTPLNDGYYALKESLKQSVRFQQANLTDPLFLSAENKFDVIFCRNVMIYLDDTARQQALQNLNRLLKDEGILFVGHVEASPAVLNVFDSLHWPGAFAFRKKIGPSKNSRTLIPRRPNQSLQRSRNKTRLTPPRAVASSRMEPIRPKQQDEPVAISLKEIEQLADVGRLQDAETNCKAFIENSTASAAAYFLLGVIQSASGAATEAEQSFSRAIYLEPDHTEAMTHLIHLAKANGNTIAAEQYKERLSRVRARTASK